MHFYRNNMKGSRVFSADKGMGFTSLSTRVQIPETTDCERRESTSQNFLCLQPVSLHPHIPMYTQHTHSYTTTILNNNNNNKYRVNFKAH